MVSQTLTDQILNYLLDAGDEGLSTAQLAERLGVTQQTIRNHIQQIEASGITLNKQGVRYSLPEHYPHRLELNPAQTWLLYLPLRRLVRAQMQRYDLVNGLLRRLARGLNKEIGEQIAPTETSNPDMSLHNVFNVVVDGWRKQRWLHIKYRAMGEAYTRLHIVAPWWFEPAVWSDSNYLLAGARQGKDIQPMTFKLDRIEWAQLTNEPFERPAAEDVLRRIDLTWGIWQRDGNPTTVVLRFENRVLDRLKETCWHPSQALSFHDDGRSIVWKATIAEPAEMIPWIRGWGPDVEVLEPTWLREQIAQDAARMAQLYGRSSDEKPSFF